MTNMVHLFRRDDIIVHKNQPPAAWCRSLLDTAQFVAVNDIGFVTGIGYQQLAFQYYSTGVESRWQGKNSGSCGLDAFNRSSSGVVLVPSPVVIMK